MATTLAVPFTTSGSSAAVNPAVIVSLAALLDKGLVQASPQEHSTLLQSYRARKNTKRTIVHVKLNQAAERTWLERAAQVQRLTNRSTRERLPVSAIAQAVAILYRVPVSGLISSGFLSQQVIELVSQPIPMTNPGADMPASETSKSTESGKLTSKAASMLPEEIEELSIDRVESPQPGRVLEYREASDRLKQIINRTQSRLAGLARQ